MLKVLLLHGDTRVADRASHLVDDHLVQRRAGSNPAVPQLGEVERFVPAAENELRDAASGCRSVHDAVAGEARREDQVFDLVMGTDDAVVIKGVDLVVARP